MKIRYTLAALALLGSMSAFAQRTPTHPLDIKDASFDQLVTNFMNWKAGESFGGLSTIDEQFYISRQRPLERIAGSLDYKADGEGDPNRHMCMWVPLDDPTSQWKALPRYCFEGDNFSNWSYVTIHGNWTSPWFRATAGLTDVAHKNGVKVGCVMSIPFGEVVYTTDRNTYSSIFKMLVEQDADGNYTNIEKFVKFLKYYGIDGVGVNSEFRSTTTSMRKIRDFFAACHKEAEKIGWSFQLHWYDGTNDNGRITFDHGLNDDNAKMFGTGDNIVTDMMFANYNWNRSILELSEDKAASLNRSSYDYYAGFDIQGRALRNNNWSALLDSKISIGFWGAHSQSLIHQSSTDNGTSDVAIQQTYLDKQELIFSGANRNPANTPGIATDCDLSNASLGHFHGLSKYLTAKSTIQQVPFVSRFNLGNGLKFRTDGVVTFDHKWHNLATQDIMPTWRWWIVDGNESAKDGGLVKADLTWDDAWFGGSCLRLSGATTLSRVKLFKTALAVAPSYTLSVTYKATNDLATHAKLFVATHGNLTSYKEVAIPNAPKFGEWTTFTTTLDKLGIEAGDTVSMIGITVDGTQKDYNLLIGELGVRNPAQTFAPVEPQIKEVEMLRGKGSSLDFKMRYASKEETGYDKTYNDEVDTWYYEIFMQQENQKEQLLTATTSWAAYVIDAPLVSGFEGRKCRFGVRAVAPDGQTKSAISWTEYKDVPYNAPSSEVAINKQVIKPGESFTVGLEDAMADPAQKWVVLNAKTGAQIFEATNVRGFETSIDSVGNYDLQMTASDGKTTTYRGKIIVSPEETGAVPEISKFTVDKATAKTGENVTYSYDIRKGEGTVSRAVAINDPNMLQISGQLQKGKTYSYALWVKVDNYAHDKQGTNLISKNTIEDKWPHNNWGDLWVQIRPELNTTDDGTGWSSGSDDKHHHEANEVSFNTMGWLHHDSPWERMITTGYSLNPGVWNHIVVTQDSADSNRQKIYFNGKKVCDYPARQAKRREDVAKTDARISKEAVADIFIGGGGVYKAALNGWVDEVQVWNKALTDDEVLRAMQGYKDGEVPAGLVGYYTFEEMNADSSFVNHGSDAALRGYTAKLVRTVGSGGESTASASYAVQKADNSATGYPGIEGTLEIKTKRTFTSNGARISTDDDKVAVVTYATAGTYGATMSLSNDWGEAAQTIDEAVTITDATGINNVEQGEDAFAVYPNPFVESVNFRFANAGKYTIRILNAAGATIQSNDFRAAAGQVVNVSVTATPGLYLVQVLRDGKNYKTVRVVKK